MAGKNQQHEVSLKMIIDGLGKFVQDQKKASGALDKTRKSAQSSDRALKGAAQASSNSTKNFSKMSQGITGGLVPAYATLAANLFALDAAFRFLKGAADFRVLQQGQGAFAAATGVAYQSLAKDIQGATRNMITFQEAAQAGAIGRAAGLSAGQLNELSKAAFTVSVALGRDVTDSFNRLVRGVTKAEPELLDELGIILRLEEATTKYAATLGKTKTQLSIYEKSQAVAVEVLTQAEEKFGKINDIMEPTANALAQVGVAFDELLNKVRPAIAGIAEPLARFISANTFNAALVMGVFATSIISSLIPSTEALRTSQSLAAEQRVAEIDRLIAKETQLKTQMEQITNLSPSQRKFAQKIGEPTLRSGGKIGNAMADGEKLNKAQISNLHSQHKRRVGMFKNMSDKQYAYSKTILNKMTKDHQGLTTKVGVYAKQQGNAIAQAYTRAAVRVQGALNSMKVGLAALSRFAMGALGWVSMIAMGVMAIRGAMAFINKDKIDAAEKYGKAVDKAVTSQKSLNEELIKMKRVRDTGLITGKDNNLMHAAEAVASANIPGMITNMNVLEKGASMNQDAFHKLGFEFATTLKTLISMDKRFEEFSDELMENGRLTDESKRKLQELEKTLMTVGAALKTVKQNNGEMIKTMNKLVQALPKQPYQELIMLLSSNVKAYQDLVNAGEAYEVHLEAASNRIEVYNGHLQMAINLQKLEANVKSGGAFSGLAGGTTSDRMQKVQTAYIKYLKEVKKLQDTELQLNTTKDESNVNTIAQLQKTKEIQVENIKNAKALFKLEKARADLMFSTYNKVYIQMENDLGKAIGAGMRGDSSQFEKIGKSFTNTITDAIGGFLSEQLLEDTIGSLLPQKDSIKDEIFAGAEKHANLIKAAIEDGGYAHGNLLLGVFNSQNKSLKNIRVDMLRSESALAGAKMSEIDARVTSLQAENNTLGKYTTAEGIEKASAEKDPKFMEEAQAYFLKTGMNHVDYSRLQKAITQKDAKQVEYDRMNELPLSAFAGANKGRLDDKKALYNDIEALKTKIANITSGGSRAILSYTNMLKDKIVDNQFTVDKNNNTIERLRGKETFEGSGVFEGGEKAFYQTRATDLTNKANTAMNAKSDLIDLDNPLIAREADQIQALFDAALKIAIPGALEKFKAENPDLLDPEGKLNTAGQMGFTKTVPGTDSTKGSDEFSKNLNQFSGVIGAMGVLTGNEEKTAKIMATVAKIQLMISIYERAKMAMDIARGEGSNLFFKAIGAFFTGDLGRDGGIMSKHGRSYSGGGVASGPNSGYQAMLHGTEAVVPLPNNRSIPVEMKGKNNGPVNTTINVNMADGSSDTTSDAETGKQFAQAINMAVLEEIGKQQRPGGLLAG